MNPPRKKFRVIDESGATIETSIPGIFAGWNGKRPDRKIFGRLDCPSGKRMKKENRVFFSSRQAAINVGYRACKVCKP